MQPELRGLLHELEELHVEMTELVGDSQPLLTRIREENRRSAINLLHYVALRRNDVRGLQERLAELGLSSLGRAEPHVLACT